jgi:hypothetical protein
MKPPATIVCSYCLEEPPACDCDFSEGGGPQRLVELRHALARRQRAGRPPQPAERRGPGAAALAELQRPNVA